MDGALSVQLDNHRALWLTEISLKTFNDQGLTELESDGGLFLVLEDSADDTFEVLAKVASICAGETLLQLLASLYAGDGQPRLA
jgi:hypothetical protein